MKKKLLGLAVLGSITAVAALASCGDDPATNGGNAVDNSGKVFNIQCWNDEFRAFFNTYMTDEGKALIAQGKYMDKEDEDGTKSKAKTGYHLDGIPVVFTETPSSDGAYQTALDIVLDAQSTASPENKVDMFLAEADYIKKYANSAKTMDITKIGVTDFSQTYNYTVQSESDTKGTVKGVSFQCCPSALIYNRQVAKKVFGTDDPAVVGEKLSTWEKFDAVAAQAKEKGCYMTACEAETYRPFSNNASTPWVNSNRELSIPKEIKQWMDQSENYVNKGYTIPADIWSDEKVANIQADANNTLCCFGPAWYYNFCMGKSKKGDWGIVEGPMAHFWGGTWLMAAAGSDNTDLVAKVMNAFINDETLCTNLVKRNNQFTNNQKVNAAIANDPSYKGNEFLAGQNDTKLFVELAKNIKFENVTVYDQYCNEGIQNYYREYLKGSVTKEKALNNFYDYISKKFPTLTIVK